MVFLRKEQPRLFDLKIDFMKHLKNKIVRLILKRIGVLISILCITNAGYCDRESTNPIPTNVANTPQQDPINPLQIAGPTETSGNLNHLGSTSVGTVSGTNNAGSISGGINDTSHHRSQNISNQQMSSKDNSLPPSSGKHDRSRSNELERKILEIKKEYEKLYNQTKSTPPDSKEKAYEKISKRAKELYEEMPGIRKELYPNGEPLSPDLQSARNMQHSVETGLHNLSNYLSFKVLGFNPSDMGIELQPMNSDPLAKSQRTASDPTDEIVKKLKAQYGSAKKKA